MIALSVLGLTLLVAVAGVVNSCAYAFGLLPGASRQVNGSRRIKHLAAAAFAGISVALFAVRFVGSAATPMPQARLTHSLLPAHAMLRRTEFALRNSQTPRHDDLRVVLLRAGDATAFVAFAPAKQRVAAARAAAMRIRVLARMLAGRNDSESRRARVVLNALADALQRYDVAEVSAAIDARVALEAELWPDVFDEKKTQ